MQRTHKTARTNIGARLEYSEIVEAVSNFRNSTLNCCATHFYSSCCSSSQLMGPSFARGVVLEIFGVIKAATVSTICLFTIHCVSRSGLYIDVAKANELTSEWDLKFTCWDDTEQHFHYHVGCWATSQPRLLKLAGSIDYITLGPMLLLILSKSIAVFCR